MLRPSLFSCSALQTVCPIIGGNGNPCSGSIGLFFIKDKRRGLLRHMEKHSCHIRVNASFHLLCRPTSSPPSPPRPRFPPTGLILSYCSDRLPWHSGLFSPAFRRGLVCLPPHCVRFAHNLSSFPRHFRTFVLMFLFISPAKTGDILPVCCWPVGIFDAVSGLW